MNCPKCKSSTYCKDGIVKGRQRYKCKACSYRYTVEQKSDVKSKETKRMALEMYLEGVGFRAIGRLLKISFVTVYYWIKDWGEQAASLKSDNSIEVVELDEMHTYIGSKKTTVGYGLLLIDMVNSTSILSVGAGEQQQG